MARAVFHGLRRARFSALARVGVGAVGLLASTALSSVVSAAEPEAEAKPEAAVTKECPPGAFCEKASTAPVEAQPRDTKATEEKAPTDDPAGDTAADSKQQSDATAGSENQNEAKVSSSDDGSVTVVLPPTSSDQPRVVVVRQRPGGGPPEVIAYEGTVRRVDPTAVKPPEDYGQPRRPEERQRRWGLQMRGSGMILPRFRAEVDGPAMGGGGISLRYRPIAPIAIDAGLDVLMGYDSNGYQRREVPFSLSMLLYLLPHSVVQPYAFAGVNLAYARVDAQRYQWNLARGTSDKYTYVGGHAGVGLELRLAPVVSLSVDGLAFVRERVDDGSKKYPEFYDRNTGETSNTSVGGQVRGGITFWW